MTKCIALVSLDRVGNLPEDRIVNTYHFEDDAGFSSDGGISVNGPGLVSRIQTFYESIGQRILSNALTGTGVVKLYNAADPKIRIPRLEANIQFPVMAGTSLPGEVALVVSTFAAPQSGVPSGRLRGRTYLGPITSSVNAVIGALTDTHASGATMTDVLAAYERLCTGGPGAFRMAVFSPTIAAGNDTLDAAWNDVVSLRMDNAWDTQRRRGAKATARLKTAINPDAVATVVAA